MSNQDERLTDLEIKVAHQEHIIQELSDVLSAQYDKIDLLEARIRRLHAKMDDHGSDQPPPVDKPPHY